MTQLSLDRWRGEFAAGALGLHRFQVEAWVDPFASWRDELERKLAAGQEDLEGEIAEGAALLDDAAGRLKGADRRTAQEALGALARGNGLAARADAALAPEVADALARDPQRRDRVRSEAFEVDVDRELARVGAWYELFPRSFGGFAGVQLQLPRLAELGFDVVYLPPIHPIGRTHRKGRNNAPAAEPGDPGSPWAIGGPEGGHTAVAPELGTLEDFERLVEAARGHGLEIALDFAIQCSPDHPWLTEHPEWFHRRPDGTLKYAENPPKRYQDIYNVNFDSPDWRGLWEALRDVVRFWVARGVRVFRVDNPHTKPLAFWRWLIGERPRRAPRRRLPLRGLHQPGADVRARQGRLQPVVHLLHLEERQAGADRVRPGAGRRGLRLLPARTSSSTRPTSSTPTCRRAAGRRSRRASCWRRPCRRATASTRASRTSSARPCAPGSEEYLDSEKYEARERRLDGPLLPLVRRLNEIRRASPPLWRIDVRFLETANPHLIGYAKGTGSGAIITVVNLDPTAAHEGLVVVPPELGLGAAFTARDLVSGEVFRWSQGGNYVRLDPAVAPMHVLRAEA